MNSTAEIRTNTMARTWSVCPFTVEPRGQRTRESLAVGGQRVSVKVSSKDTEGLFAVCEAAVGPGSGIPRQVHRYEDQCFYVLEGELLVELGSRRMLVPAETSVFVPRDVPHAYHNTGGATARVLIVAVPGGLDIFFAEMDAAARSGSDTRPGQVQRLYDKHGLELPR
jgi:quercetin dioxygenase-like cupin family protein